MLRAALFLLVFSASAHAQTYKWVDANGVVNYSNTPPPGGAAATNVQTVPDRISSYAPEPAVAQPIDVYRRLDSNEAEWLQRQRIMAMQQAAQAAPAAEPVYPAYVLPYYATRRPIVRPVFFAPKPVQRPAQRASLKISRL